MNIDEYCGKMDFSILQFIFSFIDHVREKIEKKKLIYKEQIARYVQQQTDFFFIGSNLKSSLLQAYKYEIYNTIMFKLENILKEHNVLQCI